jgi:hypothetical protein
VQAHLSGVAALEVPNSGRQRDVEDGLLVSGHRRVNRTGVRRPVCETGGQEAVVAKHLRRCKVRVSCPEQTSRGRLGRSSENHASCGNHVQGPPPPAQLVALLDIIERPGHPTEGAERAERRTEGDEAAAHLEHLAGRE